MSALNWKLILGAVVSAIAGAIGWAFVPGQTTGSPSYATTAQIEELSSELAELRANVAGNGAGLQSILDTVAAKDDVAALQARLAKAEAALKSGMTTGSTSKRKR